MGGRPVRIRRWLPWGMGGLLVLGLWLAGGCGGDDDEETADTAAGAGAAAAGGGGSGGSADTGSATNAASDEAEADADAGAGGEADADAGAALTAPVVLAPRNGQIFYTALATPGSGLKPNVIVTCRWLPVPGAADYQVTMENSSNPGHQFSYYTEETTFSGRYLFSEVHTWSVRARDAAGETGPASKSFTFTIRDWIIEM